MITQPDCSILITTITATDIFFSGESGLIMLVIMILIAFAIFHVGNIRSSVGLVMMVVTMMMLVIMMMIGLMIEQRTSVETSRNCACQDFHNCSPVVILVMAMMIHMYYLL